MATRTETRFADKTALSTTYVNLVTATGLWNILVNITNRTSSVSNLQLFIADNSWSSGEPTGGTLKAAIAYNFPIGIGDVAQISGIVLNNNEKLVAYASVASSLDITVNGVVIV